MHVAIVCPYSFGFPGGAQEFCRGLARSLRDRRHEVSLFAPHVGRDAEGLDGVVTVSLGGAVRVPANGSLAPLGIDPRMVARLELGLDPADVINVHEPFLPASVLAAFRAPRGVPVVGTFHAAADRFLPYAIAAPVLGPPLRRRLRATTASSEASRALARRYAGVDPVIVPNGFDTAAFAGAEPDGWTRSLGRVVLFVGRPEPRKGFDLLLRAFAGAAAFRPDVHLVCVGPAAASGSRFAEGLGGRVHCLGHVELARLMSIYRAAEIFCAPNLAGESFGRVVVEAMAAGCAVIASDLPGMRYAGGDAVEYGAAGDLAAWRETLSRLLDDEARRSELAGAAPERAKQFDWSVVTDQMLEVFERARDETASARG
jgi:phosphatidylinositol alpha-mannosyltransferase